MQDFYSDFEIFSQSWWPYIISLVISIISAIRIYVGGTYCESLARLDGKYVIITGGSSGIGLATAKELAKRGANLILAIRNAEKGAKALDDIKMIKSDANVIIKILDVSDFCSIRNFVEQLKNEYDKIDILINNAGTICQPPRKTAEGNELTYVTNYLGPFLLTHLLLPLLSKSDNGRVINVSALAHYNGKLNIDTANIGEYNGNDAFAGSKLALTLFTKHMAQLYKDTNITFNSVSPGLVRNTGHLANYSTLENSLLTKLSVWPWVWLFLKNPKQGCQSIVYLAVEPTLHKVSGCYFSDCEIKDPADVVNDSNIAKTLYEKSCKIVNIDPKTISVSTRNEATKVEG
nr:retinol dehydrogenase 13-like [Leptinotarsa decemlineata]